MGITRWKYIFGVSANAKMPRLGSKAAKAKLKEIGGSLYERWSVWFNSIIRVESYQCTECDYTSQLTLLVEDRICWYCMAVVSSCYRV